jgi:hypothetical protein
MTDIRFGYRPWWTETSGPVLTVVWAADDDTEAQRIKTSPVAHETGRSQQPLAKAEGLVRRSRTGGG